MKDFENRLKGGHPNSLGNTEEVVEEVLEDISRFEELFNCYFSDDEVVRLRTSSAVKRVCIADKKVLTPYIDRLLNEISKIDQASTQWTLSTLFMLLEDVMSSDQKNQSLQIMKNNLVNHNDWIVLNTTMETLTNWAKEDEALKDWLIPHLDRLSLESRKSVAGRAKKMMGILEKV
ncbi:MAG: hypothetical protein NXI20_19795 [bacterium]|nr:hypothetical protein [bacterium]